MKFLSKHYIFIVIVALLTLVLGLSFSLAPKDADAASRVKITVNYETKWSSAASGSTRHGTGKYVNSQGEEFDLGAIGSVYVGDYSFSTEITLSSTLKIFDKDNTELYSTSATGQEITKDSVNTYDGDKKTLVWETASTNSFWGVDWEFETTFKATNNYLNLFETPSSNNYFMSLDYSSGAVGQIGRFEENRNKTESKTFRFQLYSFDVLIYDISDDDYTPFALDSNCYKYPKTYDPDDGASKDARALWLKYKTYPFEHFSFLDDDNVSKYATAKLKRYGGGYSIKFYAISSLNENAYLNPGSDIGDQIEVTKDTYIDNDFVKTYCIHSPYYKPPTDLHLPLGWNMELTGNTASPEEHLIIVPEVVPNNYTITYDSGSGTGGPTSATATFDKAYPTLKSLPTAPTGYNFNGYWTAAEGGKQVYDASGQRLTEKIGTYSGPIQYRTIGDSTLYAQYTRASYNLTFNPNGGAFAEGATTTISATYGLEYPAITLSPATVPTGKYFNGYWTKTSGGTQIYDASLKIVKGATYTSTSDKTLYAQYLSNKYTVQYFDTGPPDNNTTATATATATYGLTLNLRTPNANPGHYFSGWKQVGTENVYDGSIKTPNWGANGTTIKLYAVWTAEKYKFVFDSNGGSSVSDQIYTYGVTYPLPPPTRTGYTFAGWKINGNSTAVSGSYTVNTDFGNNGATVSCVAQWTPIGYTVRFNGNGGAITAGATTVDQAFTYNKKQQLKSNAFVKSGYIFTGWAESVGGSVAYYNMQEVINLASTKGAIKNLYAVWGETWLNGVTTADKPSLKNPSQTNSASNPYLITSGKNLAWMALQTQTSSLSGYYQQEGDIDLYGKEWIPIGKSSSSFIGTYDGNGYEIKNIKISAITNVKRENNGLFGYGSSNATLKNIIVSSGEINGNGAYTGGIVGRIEGSGQVKNCVNFATINSSFVTINSSLNSVGGIAGRIGTEAIIENCANYANVTGYNNVGGIVGNAAATSSTISKCYVDLIVTVKGNSGVGGIAGIQYMADRKLYISFSAFLGTIDANSNYGAFIGQADSTSSSVSNCYAKAVIPSRAKYYGLVGNCGANIINNCVFETKLASETSYTKRYRGTSFENWVILQGTNIAVPSGLTWIGTGGEKITDIQQLKDIGYTSV